MDMWYILFNRVVPRYERDKKPTAFPFDLYMQNASQTKERKIALGHGKRQSGLKNQFPDMIQFSEQKVVEFPRGMIWIRYL